MNSLSQFQGDLFQQILSSRHAKRAFLRPSKESNGRSHTRASSLPLVPPDDLISQVLRNSALGTPSTKNTQPCGISILKDPILSSLSHHLLQKFDAEPSPSFDKSEYENRPENPTLSHFDERVASYGRELFAWKGIDRVNEQHRKEHDRENYTFFNAPLVLLLHIPERAVAGTFVDAGLFLQSVLLGFHAYGYGCCPQYALTRFSKTIREFHKVYGVSQKGQMNPLIPDERILVCGISIGVVDPDAKVNHFAPSRKALHDWVEFFGGEDQNGGEEGQNEEKVLDG
eukprot:CAMPEP_0117449848 /NCGR_PEP_ID=MMETSP0759-20121206/8157_1 /TAXON_ID=63605 /ORGANISM="Percolomonas cosmopolitus, Strain WS" /LENGTH=284 /DNA_ID=CAMNT_0005242337 /DNA_START=123 /DNA_END=977 /DNA_ORIENTATION=+